MIETSGGKIRSVAWSEIFPWLCIVRAFRLAISIQALLLGAVGIFLTVAVWGLIGTAFSSDSPATTWLQPYIQSSWLPITAAVPESPTVRNLQNLAERSEPVEGQWAVRDPMLSPWALLSQPAFEGLLYSPQTFSWSSVAALVLCGLWGVAVWAFFGGAICRIAAVRLAADEQVGLGAALRFASRKGPAYFAAPLLPLGGVLLAVIPVFVLGLLMRTDFGLVLGGVLWPLALLAAFIMAVLLLGSLFGWPLMWGAISTEGSDSFDALSRSYAYLFQRPLHYLFYVVVAAIVGWLGWLLVQNFAAAVIWLAYWAAEWGSGAGGGEASGLGKFGVDLIHFWVGCVKLLAVGFVFSYFWSASSAIYLLLRHDVDATEMDEVFLDADATEQEPVASSAQPAATAENGESATNGNTAE